MQSAASGPVEQPLIPAPEPRVPGVLSPNRLRFALAGFGGAMFLLVSRAAIPIGGVGNAIEFGRTIGESGGGSLAVFGAISFATVLSLTDVRAALFVEYAHHDAIGVAIGAATGLSIASLWLSNPYAYPYVGLPVRLTWYARPARGEHLHSVFVTVEAEPDILPRVSSDPLFAFHVFSGVGYVIH